jgi:hypothetical protein
MCLSQIHDDVYVVGSARAAVDGGGEGLCVVYHILYLLTIPFGRF